MELDSRANLEERKYAPFFYYSITLNVIFIIVWGISLAKLLGGYQRMESWRGMIMNPTSLVDTWTDR